MSDINLIKADLSEAANTLVTRVADACGILYEPRRIKNKAKAESEAMITLAKAQGEVTAIEQRAINRLLVEEVKKQKNAEAILAGSLSKIDERAKPENVDDDWIVNFFDKAKMVSDEEMRLIWSRLLAEETNNPGRFSKRTVNLVEELDKNDARLFSTLANFTWNIGGKMTPLIFNLEDEVYVDNEINFINIKQLDALGLISFDSLGGYKQYQRDHKGGTFLALYGATAYKLQLPEDNNTEITTGKVMYTKLGEELFKICSLVSVKGFEKYVIDKYKKDKFEISKIAS